MRRSLLAVLALSLLAAGCSTSLGRSVPACDTETGTLILEIQSVPGADYVPCVVALPTGWEYKNMVADSSGATFWIDSDRMGEPFLTVQAVPRCNPSAFEPADSTEPGGRLFKDVTASSDVSIVVVPEGQSRVTEARAVEIVTLLKDDTIEGRRIDISVDAGQGTTAQRMAVAERSGSHVIAVSIRDAEDETVSLSLFGGTGEQRMDSLDDALDAIEDVTTEPSYRGRWFYAFPGGCAIYTFDASGPGVATIEEDVAAALDLFEVGPLREEARDAGFRLP